MKFKKYIQGVISEGKRVRWPHGPEFREDLVVCFAYTIFFSLFLLLSDALVLQMLKVLQFK